MSTTSQKHRNFVAEPMNEKPVTDLAGIGEVLGKRLEAKGFDKVGNLIAFKFRRHGGKELFTVRKCSTFDRFRISDRISDS